MKTSLGFTSKVTDFLWKRQTCRQFTWYFPVCYIILLFRCFNQILKVLSAFPNQRYLASIQQKNVAHFINLRLNKDTKALLIMSMQSAILDLSNNFRERKHIDFFLSWIIGEKKKNAAFWENNFGHYCMVRFHTLWPKLFVKDFYQN